MLTDTRPPLCAIGRHRPGWAHDGSRQQPVLVCARCGIRLTGGRWDALHYDCAHPGSRRVPLIRAAVILGVAAMIPLTIRASHRSRR